MQLKIFTIRDSKGECYNTPFFQKTTGEAERSFRELVNDQKSMVSKYPDDFDLYMVGEYNDQTGVIEPMDTPLHLVKAINVQKPTNP
nr:MAG: nonstructural protein [Microvirus sp.]